MYTHIYLLYTMYHAGSWPPPGRTAPGRAAAGLRRRGDMRTVYIYIYIYIYTYMLYISLSLYLLSIYIGSRS